MLTETAPIVSVTHPFHIQAGSVGKAIAGVDVKIAPHGEILVRGENVTGGYFEAEAETAQAFEGGWFHTGDIGEIGPDGRLFIRGRKKEVIVTPGGLKVFPDDIERVVKEIPGVRDSAAIGASTGPETAVSGCTSCSCWIPAWIPTPSFEMRTLASRLTRRFGVRSSGRTRRCPVPRGPAS